MKKRKLPVRKCVSCGEMKVKKELFRVVRTPDNAATIDSVGKTSGRGAYLCMQVKCVMSAKKKGAVERHLTEEGGARPEADWESIYESLIELCEDYEK